MSSSEWNLFKLSDLTEIIGGGTPKTTNPDYWNGNIPWLSVVDFSGNNKFVYKTEKNITQLGLQNSSTKILQKGQLIISARGTVGEIAMLGIDMAFNQSCYGLNAKDVTTNDFLYYLLKFKIEDLKRNTHGAVFDTITRTTFDHIEINLPSLPSQHRIADILSALDEMIELNRQMNETLESMAKAIFKEWFAENEEAENWKLGKLGDFGNIVCGKTPSKAKSNYFGGEIPFIKIPDMHRSIFITQTEDSLTQEGAESQKNKFLPPYSIIVSCIATVGLVAITSEQSQTNQQINAIIPRNKFSAFYLYFCAKELEGILKELGSGGSATLNVNTTSFSRIDCLIPPNEILMKFDEVVRPLFDKILTNQQQTATLASIRDALLPKLMSGEVEI